MAHYGSSGLDKLPTPKRRNGSFFTKTPMDASQSFIFRDKEYASPSAALDAYLISELGEGKLRSQRKDVEDLLMFSAFEDSPRNSTKNSARGRNFLDEIDRKKSLSIRQMVDKAYKQLQEIKRHSINDVLTASEVTLNKISADNLSSLPSAADSQISTSSTCSLLPIAPDIIRDEKYYREGERIKYPLNLSLEKLKRSLNERDRENLLASHLTSKALGTLAKLKREKSRSQADTVSSESDLSEQLQKLRDELQENGRKKSGPEVVRISGRLMVGSSTGERSRQKHSKRSDASKQKSRDDSYLDYMKDLESTHNMRTKRVVNTPSEWPTVDKQSMKNRGPPSWVEDLANTEISSVVDLHFSENFPLSSGQALSLDDLSDSYRRKKEASRVFRGRHKRDRGASAIDVILSNDLTAPSFNKTEDDADFDVASLTTDDLCFAAPDASNLKSILRIPSSTPRKRLSRLSSSTDDLITESLQPITHSSPAKDKSPSRQGVRFKVNGDVYDKEGIHDLGDDNFLSKNQTHRDYLKQLMKDIEESESVITSSSLHELKNDAMQDKNYPVTSSKQQTGMPSDIAVSEDGNVAEALNQYANGYESRNDHFGYLEKIQRLLATPPPPDNLDPISDINASQNTEDVLNGDRSWEKLPNFHNAPSKEVCKRLLGEQNIIDQFLEECKGTAASVSSHNVPPGGMEALKNMLFTVQTLVPSGDLSEQQDNSVSSIDTNEKQPSGNQNTIPENLRHLLASDSDVENSENNGNSLSVAMQHLDTLKNLMGSRRLPQMTSTPNK